MSYSRGALFHLLKNRIYLGEIVHGDLAMSGRHTAIVDANLFDRVQQLLKSNAVKRLDRLWSTYKLRQLTLASFTRFQDDGRGHARGVN